MIKAHGMAGTFFVITGRFGDPAHSLTLDQVKKLAADGHEIGSHTISHTNFMTIDTEAQRRELCNSRKTLLDAGLRVTSFAYPFGRPASGMPELPVAEQLLRDCGYNAARGSGGLLTGIHCIGCDLLEKLPPADSYHMRALGSAESTWTLADMQGFVSQREGSSGWLTFVMHRICNDPTNPQLPCAANGITPELLEQFLGWLQGEVAGGRVVVKTVDQAIGGDLKPGVFVPPPPPPLAGSNLAVNPSLEADRDENLVPDCWQPGSSGTNSAVYSLTSVAHSGGVAQQIDVTDLVSGGRRLVTLHDAGACAPRAYPGHVYEVSAWYTATATDPAVTSPVRFTGYYGNAGGVWVYFAQSPVLPVSAAYTQARWTLPPLPAGAELISVGMTLVANGQVRMDDFELRDTDMTPPSVAFSSFGNGDLVNGMFHVAAAADDAGGIYKVDLLVDGVSFGAMTKDATGDYGLDWDTRALVDGPVTLTAHAYDLAGNVSSSSTSVVIDNTVRDRAPPVTTLLCDGGACRTGWYTQPISVSLSVSDSGMGIGAVRYTIDGTVPDGTNGTSYSVPFMVPTDTIVRFRAYDAAGDGEIVHSVALWFDLVVPEVTMTCNGAACAAWYNKAVTVTLGAAAGSSGAAISYTLDGSDPALTGLPYASPFTLPAGGTVRATAVSGAGLVSAPFTQVIGYDVSPPTNVQVSLPTDGAPVTGIYRIYSSPPADNVGVTRVRFFLDGKQLGTQIKAPWKWVWDTSTATNGPHTIQVVAEDAAGNSTASPPITVVVVN
jgi:peptidoglycan/xylan/chitin deacetylase (PgdA/CDA1 family)